MPWGATEEPDVEQVMGQSVPVHVVSTDAKPGKSIAPEFGQWRSFLIQNKAGNDSATPGAQRILNRSLRRHRAHILVNSAGAVTQAAPTLPSITVSGQAVQNTTGNPVVATLAGFTLTQVFVNGILVGATNGPYVVPAYGSISATFTVLGTTTWTGVSGPQSSQDGVIIGSREVINTGQPMTPGNIGGFLNIGDNLRWEVQQELWAAYPVTNGGPVIVSVCDEIYASDPDSWKGDR